MRFVIGSFLFECMIVDESEYSSLDEVGVDT